MNDDLYQLCPACGGIGRLREPAKVNTGGTTVFSGAVNGLASITTDAPGLTQLNNGGIVTTGAQTYNDAVSLGTATVGLTASVVTFGSTLNGASDLTITGNAVFNGGFKRFDTMLKAFPKTKFIAHADTFWANVSADYAYDTAYPSGPIKPGGIRFAWCKAPRPRRGLSAPEWLLS